MASNPPVRVITVTESQSSAEQVFFKHASSATEFFSPNLLGMQHSHISMSDLCDDGFIPSIEALCSLEGQFFPHKSMTSPMSTLVSGFSKTTSPSLLSCSSPSVLNRTPVASMAAEAAAATAAANGPRFTGAKVGSSSISNSPTKRSEAKMPDVNVAELYLHAMTRESEEGKWCHFCRLRFPNVLLCNLHVFYHDHIPLDILPASNPKYKCRQCHVEMYYTSSMKHRCIEEQLDRWSKRLMRFNGSMTPLVCVDCVKPPQPTTRVFASQFHLALHTIVVHGNQLLSNKCPICQAAFTFTIHSSANLIKLLEMHAEQVHVAELGINFLKALHSRNYSKVDVLKTTFYCLYPKNCSLFIREKEETGKAKCCDSAFNTLVQLQAHWKYVSHLPVPKKDFRQAAIEDLTPNILKKQENLMNEKFTEMRKRKYPILRLTNTCFVCFMVFKDSVALQVHMCVIHQATSLEECGLCGFRYWPQPPSIRVTVNSNTVQMPPEVSYSPVTVQVMWQLINNHQQTHAQEIRKCNAKETEIMKNKQQKEPAAPVAQERPNSGIYVPPPQLTSLHMPRPSLIVMQAFKDTLEKTFNEDLDADCSGSSKAISGRLEADRIISGSMPVIPAPVPAPSSFSGTKGAANSRRKRSKSAKLANEIEALGLKPMRKKTYFEKAIARYERIQNYQPRDQANKRQLITEQNFFTDANEENPKTLHPDVIYWLNKIVPLKVTNVSDD